MLYFGEERLWLSHKEVVTHSIPSVFAMEIYLSRVYPETTTIIGRWPRNSFLQYICIQVINFRKDISDLMVTTQTFYIIPKAEVIY